MAFTKLNYKQVNKMSEHQLVIKDLIALVEKYSISEKGTSACMISLKSIFDDDEFKESLSDYKLEDIEVSLAKHGLIFLNSSLGYPYIESVFVITCALIEDGENTKDDIGEYRFISSMDGEYIDEYLDIDNLY